MDKPGLGSERLRDAGRDSIKAAVRLVGLASSGFRPPPDFLIIGAKRGGTTSLYFDLLDHPSILKLFPPPVPGLKSVATKGVHYFDSAYFRGDRWYRSYMPTRATRMRISRKYGVPAKTGEASPFYLFHPAAAGRAHAAIPEVSIILLLRDPVMRAYSHWKQQRRSGMETLDFPAALDAEAGRIKGERERLLADPRYLSHAWEQQSYVAQGKYAESLRPWLDLYGRSRMFVAASEDYYARPNQVLGDIYEFLGLPRISTSTGAQRNAAAGEDLPPLLVTRLRDTFAAPNHDLAAMLGQSFPWT
jgi:sulfotransferase family protein